MLNTPPDRFGWTPPSGAEPYADPLGVPKALSAPVLGTDPKSAEKHTHTSPLDHRFELHWHAFAEYAVVLRGKVIHTLGTESLLQAGDYVVVLKIPHGWEVNPSGDILAHPARWSADQIFVKP